MKNISIWIKSAGLGIAAAALVACGGGGESAPAAPTVSGVAATGLPLVGATVSLRCADAATSTTTTDSSGAYSLSLTGRTAPCVLRTNGGTVGGAAYPLQLHSLATGAGVANLTPLTHLVVAQVAGGPANAMFDNFDAAAIARVTNAAVTAARAAVIASLNAQNLGDLSALGDFIRAVFQAVLTNAHDQALEALAQAMAGRNLTLNDVEAAVLAGGGGGGGGGTATCNTALFQAGSVREATPADLSARAGTYVGDEYTSTGFPPNLVETIIGPANVVFSTSGTLTFNNTALTLQSLCVDTTAGLIYLHFQNGHIDLFTDGSLSGVSPSAVPPAFVLVRGQKT